VNATRTGCETSPASGRETGRRAALVFFGTMALIFAVTAIVTILSSAAMESMGAMPMAGGWLLSGIWLPLCGQSWFETAACFVGMWLVMMVAMMLPSFAPVLWHYQNAAFTAGATQPGRLATLAGAGYFAAWAGFGLLIFLLGAALAQAAMQFPLIARLAPVAGALVVLFAGLSQLSRWKARLLADCGGSPDALPAYPGVAGALRTGTALGLRCCISCIGPIAILIAGGLMDLRLMLCVTLAITAERLLPAEARIADAIGVLMAAAGLLLLVQVLG